MAVTANPAANGVLLTADESSFAETSTTFDERLPFLNDPGEITSGLQQGQIESTRTVQYKNDGHNNFRGIKSASFPIELWMTGHGSSTTGAVSATQLATSLGRWIGTSVASADGGTVTGTPTDADTFSVTGVTCAAGGLMRIGAIGDGRGDGQWHRMDDVVTPSDPIVLNALAATPNSGDVVYGAEWVHPLESPTAALPTTERYAIYTANQGYHAHGVWCSGIDLIGWSPGQIPRVRATMNAARWSVDSSFTFPDSTSMQTFTPAPVSAGSFFLQEAGTTTRNLLEIRDFQASIELETFPVVGPGASDDRQTVIGVNRGKCQLTFTITLDREAQGADTYGDIWNTVAASRNYYHMMYSLSASHQTALGLYCPKVMIVDSRPVQSNIDGLNRHQITFRAITGGTTTTELTRANFVIGIG